MSSEHLLRVIGFLSLFAAIGYLLYLFAPRPEIDWPALRGRMQGAGKRLRDVKEQFAEVGMRLQDLGRVGGPSLEERGAEMSLLEGYDEDHAARIARSARLLAEAVSLDEDTLASLEEACYLHDIGAEELAGILSKPSAMSPEELSRMRQHPVLGAELATEEAEHPQTPYWVRWHHERMDGTGYPDALVGEEIPLPARILGIADAFEAISHKRPYRQALDPQDALTELRSGAGNHYDPTLVEIFTNRVFPRLAHSTPSPDGHATD